MLSTDFSRFLLGSVLLWLQFFRLSFVREFAHKCKLHSHPRQGLEFASLQPFRHFNYRLSFLPEFVQKYELHTRGIVLCVLRSDKLYHRFRDFEAKLYFSMMYFSASIEIFVRAMECTCTFLTEFAALLHC